MPLPVIDSGNRVGYAASVTWGPSVGRLIGLGHIYKESAKKIVDRGFYGPKTGRGFYDYGGRSEGEVVRKRDLAYLAVLDALEAADAFSPL